MKELKTKIKVRSLNNSRKFQFTVMNKFLFITCILFSSCNFTVKTLGPLHSLNVEESKKIGVFLWKYYPVEVKFYDTIYFSIKEVFAEKQI